MYEHLLNELRRTAERVNEVLLPTYHVQPRILDESANHLLVTGGKRIRAFITVTMCQALGGDAEMALPAAAAVEYVHNFSMIHDDIMDNDAKRHGAPTVHVKYGTPMAILAGDVLFAKAFAITSEELGRIYAPEISRKMVNILAKTSITLCEGQAMDIQLAGRRKIPSKEQYMLVIEKKTAALISAAAMLGALAANGQSYEVEKAAFYGRNLGLAYQLVDDILSIVGDEHVTGKPLGSDLREGKKTLPIILAFERAGSQASNIRAVWGAKNVQEDGVKLAIENIKSLGVERTVRQMAKRYARDAARSISTFAPSQAHDLLVELTKFAVTREH